MKRTVIVIVLLLSMTAMSIVSIWQIKDTKEVIDEQVERIASCARENDTALLSDEVQRLISLWKDKETVLAHYVHHDKLENIALSVSRLPAIASNEREMEKLHEQLAVITWQIEHIWSSELPNFDNIF